MADSVEKLKLPLGAILFPFESIGLKELCSFTGVQEPEYEGKTKRQLIEIINGKLDTLIEDEDKIVILNNITGKSKKVVTSKPPGGNAAVSISNDRNKHPLKQTIQASQPSTALTSMQSWELSGRKKLISLK